LVDINLADIPYNVPLGAGVALTLFQTLLAAIIVGLLSKVTIDDLQLGGFGERTHLLPVQQTDSPSTTTVVVSEVVPSLAQELLKDTVENSTPFFLASWSALTMLSYLEDNAGPYLAVAILVGIFFVARFLHAIAFSYNISGFQSFLTGLSSFVTVILAIIGIFIAGVSKTEFSTKMVNLTVSVVITILVFKTIGPHLLLQISSRSGDEAMTTRLGHVIRNDLESFIPLAGILPLWYASTQLMRAVGPNSDSQIAGGIGLVFIFLLSRMSHSLAYVLEMQPYRTLAWTVSFLAVATLGIWGFVITLRFNVEESEVKSYWQVSFLSGLILLEAARSWIIAIITGSIRTRTGNFNVEEDRSLPFGMGKMIGEEAKVEQINSYVEFHAKDLSMQLALWFTLHLLAGPNEIGTVSSIIYTCVVLTLFVVSRYLVMFLVLWRKYGAANFLFVVALLHLAVLVGWSFAVRMINFHKHRDWNITMI